MLLRYSLTKFFTSPKKKGHGIEAVREHLRVNRQIQIVGLSDKLIEKSMDIIKKTSRPKSGFPSFYDAIYHALAMINDCDFITADRRHYEKTKALGKVKLLDDMKTMILAKNPLNLIIND